MTGQNGKRTFLISNASIFPKLSPELFSEVVVVLLGDGRGVHEVKGVEEVGPGMYFWSEIVDVSAIELKNIFSLEIVNTVYLLTIRPSSKITLFSYFLQ